MREWEEIGKLQDAGAFLRHMTYQYGKSWFEWEVCQRSSQARRMGKDLWHDPIFWKDVNDRVSTYHPCLYKGLERTVVCVITSQDGDWEKEERDPSLLQLQM